MLEKLVERRKKELADLLAKAEASRDAAEVKDLAARGEAIKAEIAEMETELKAAEDRKAKEREIDAIRQEPRNPFPASGEAKPEDRADDPTNSIEYRTAFMRYVQHGTPIPKELRQDGPTVSSEVSALIPTVVMDEVVKTADYVPYGNLYRRVRRISIPAGVQFPISNLSATWSWDAEDACPNPQKAGEATGYVTFNAFLGHASISISIVAKLMTLPVFEQELGRLIREAYLKAMDEAILNGTGAGQPLGIFSEDRITKHADFASTDELTTWEEWNRRLWRIVPADKRGGTLVLGSSTMYNYLYNVKDTNGHPMFTEVLDSRAAKGNAIDGVFMGRELLILPDELLPDFADADVNEFIGFYAPLRDYCLNEIGGFGVTKYYDQKCHRDVTEGLAVVDGKVVDPKGFILIKKVAPPEEEPTNP